MKWDRLIPWLHAHDLEVFLWTFAVLVANGLIKY